LEPPDTEKRNCLQLGADKALRTQTPYDHGVNC